MNIFIPIGGVGKRFSDDGYFYPKPLINALGKPLLFWVLDCLNTHLNDVIYIAYQPALLSRFDFERRVRIQYPEKKFEFVLLQQQTRGAAGTIGIMSQNVAAERRSLPCITLDSDTYYRSSCDVLQLCKSVLSQADTDGAVVCFETHETEPIYSYVVLDETSGLVREIAEKKKVSSLANTGCYMFCSADWLEERCQTYLDQNDDDEAEAYTSMLLMHTIKTAGARIRKQLIDPSDFVVLGTPFQLKLYCHLNAHKAGQHLRFCFDLDGTLLSRLPGDTDYTSVTPIHSNVSMLRFLHDIGHTIIIYTARRMKTHSGNVGASIADIGANTIKTLDSLNIPYDELVFGKPYAHYYVDDLAINPNIEDLAKVIGFYPASVRERHFNSVRRNNIAVIEKVSSDQFTLDGEVYWYENMPAEVQDLFPRYYGRIPNGYMIETIEGIPFSYLYQQGNLSVRHLKMLLEALDRIHRVQLSDDASIYSNYCEKLRSRQQKYAKCYNALDEAGEQFNILIEYFDRYKDAGLGKNSVIHGDPVFSNILLTDNERSIKLIDMRGRQGEVLTLMGDAFYDYAKVFQCLMGYDFVLSGAPARKASRPLLNCFWEHVGSANTKLIHMITCSLVLSLIPLHETYIQPVLYRFLTNIVESTRRLG